MKWMGPFRPNHPSSHLPAESLSGYQEFAERMGNKGFLGNIPRRVADMILNYQWVEGFFRTME